MRRACARALGLRSYLLLENKKTQSTHKYSKGKLNDFQGGYSNFS